MVDLTIHCNKVGWGRPEVAQRFHDLTKRWVYYVYAHANAEVVLGATVGCELEIMAGLEPGGAPRAVNSIAAGSKELVAARLNQWQPISLKADETLRLTTDAIDVGQCWNYWLIAGADTIRRKRSVQKCSSALIREWHRLELPDLYGFNACLSPTTKGYVAVYRAPQNALTACTLDHEYRATSDGVRLGMQDLIDARLIHYDSRLWLSSCFIPGDCTDLRPLDAKALIVGRAIRFDTILDWPGYQKGIEKNWSPWVQGGQLFYSHWPKPHRVLRVDFPNEAARLVAEYHWKAPNWRADLWGDEFRGNGPAVSLGDGTFLSTFHTIHGDGYYNGFYRFEGVPPFRVVGVSSEPYLTPGDATGRPTNRGGCIFVVGMQIEDGLVRISGGDNDHSSVVCHLFLNDVLEALVPT
jgi:hypothetical protein